MAVQFISDLNSVSPEQLTGFFVDWPDHPNPATHLRILHGSYAVWLAMEEEKCIGFVNAISDGVFYAFVPLLEVLPSHQGLGIGKELLNRILASLDHMYAVDVLCDEKVASFYDRAGFSRCVGMAKRNYENQGAVGRNMK